MNFVVIIYYLLIINYHFSNYRNSKSKITLPVYFVVTNQKKQEKNFFSRNPTPLNSEKILFRSTRFF